MESPELLRDRLTSVPGNVSLLSVITGPFSPPESSIRSYIVGGGEGRRGGREECEQRVAK